MRLHCWFHFRLVCLLFLTLSRVAAPRADILISEILAINDRGAVDEDGDRSDWIELVNTSAESVSLAGWHLTDDRRSLAKWRFPAVSLPPYSHLLVWASNKNRDNPAAPLHTNFRISGNDPFVALVRPDGATIVSSLGQSAPPQVADVSFGLPVRVTSDLLVPAGASARIASPSDGAWGESWTTLDFDDGSWRTATGPFGFERNPVQEERTLLADSVSDFSGEQGKAGWWYGSYNRTADVGGRYAAADFQPFPNKAERFGPDQFWDGSLWRWGLSAPPPWVRLGRTETSPGRPATGFPEIWTIRRWIAPATTDYEVDWAVAKLRDSTLNILGSVALRGGILDTLTLEGANRDGLRKTVTLRNVQAGDPIDLILAPQGSGAAAAGENDLTRATAQIRALSTLTPKIASDVSETLQGRSSLFVRYRFNAVNPQLLERLVLKISADDGWIAWINGVEVARARVPDETLWNSNATEARPDFEAIEGEVVDLSAHRGRIQKGANILAIQVLNVRPDDDDLLAAAELTGTYLEADTASARYFSPPTPGKENGFGAPHVGPLITQVKHTPSMPADDEPLYVFASVRQAFSPVQTVTLTYRVHFGSELNVEMRDDGLGVDATRGDGIWTAAIPASASTPGQMVRYFITATDRDSRATRWPSYIDKQRQPQYEGTVVKDPSLTNALPVLHWFVQNTGAADSSSTRCSIFYDGQFYDNIVVGVHGQSSRSFPKHSYNFDTLPGFHFQYLPGSPRVDDFNLLTTYPDKAKVRNILAYETFRDSGHPYHLVLPMRIQRNGAFFGDFHWVEDGDEEYLRRVGLDPNGALYKMYDTLGSTATAEKKTRKSEARSDLQALINGVRLTGVNRTRYLYDNIDLPGMANYLAAMIITGGADCCHKNYYAYRDSDGSGEWVYLPWDQDLTFGRNWTGAQAYFDDTMYSQNPLFIGDNNSLISALFADTAFRQMYLRRVRSLMDQLLQPASTPFESRLYERRIADLAQLIAPDAALDFAKWPTWGIKQDLRAALGILTNQYMPARRRYLFETLSAPRGVIPAPTPDRVAIQFGAFEAQPVSGDSQQEYLQLVNPNAFAADISGWRVTGDIEHTLKPGTVLPANGRLHLTPSPRAFRARLEGPRGNQGLFVQGGYRGQLSRRGGAVQLLDRQQRQIAELVLPPDPTPAQKHLRISELHYHPPGAPDSPESRLEFIEFVNTGPDLLNLESISLTGGVEFRFQSASIRSLRPGDRCLLVADRALFENRYKNPGQIAGEFSGRLANGGDRIRVEDAGEVVLDFTYSPEWAPATDGDGFTLVATRLTAEWQVWKNADHWRPSAVRGGTPGFDETAYAAWLAAHFGPSGNAVRGAVDSDPDGDGFDNASEFRQGWNPNDPGSPLLIQNVAFDPATRGLRVRFKQLAGRRYAIETREELGSGEWRLAQQVGPANASIEASIPLETPTSTARRFYRLRLIPD